MQGSEMTIGKRYAMGLRVSPGEPLIKVQLLDKGGRRSMVKVRHLSEPHEGLEEYVKTRQIVVPWGERKAFLRDEERMQQLRALPRPPGVHARAEAVYTVLASTGYPDAYVDDDGYVDMEAEELRQIALRASIDPALENLHPAAFVDRHGGMHLPLEPAEQLARAFAAAEPQLVLLYIDYEERR